MLLQQIHASISEIIASTAAAVTILVGIVTITRVAQLFKKDFATKGDIGHEVELIDSKIETINKDVADFAGKLKEYKEDHSKQHKREALINSEFREMLVDDRKWLKQEITELRKDIRALKS